MVISARDTVMRKADKTLVLWSLKPGSEGDIGHHIVPRSLGSEFPHPSYGLKNGESGSYNASHPLLLVLTHGSWAHLMM